MSQNGIVEPTITIREHPLDVIGVFILEEFLDYLLAYIMTYHR